MSEFSEPSRMRGSNEYGQEKSGNGRPAPTGPETLFILVVILHFIGVIVALFFIGSTFGSMPTAIAFVFVTIGWLAWIRKYQRDDAARRLSAEVDAARNRAAKFTDPRT